MEAPLWALKELGFQTQHLSSTEYATGPQTFILRNFMPRQLLPDILRRDPKCIPRAAIYVAGFPCKVTGCVLGARVDSNSKRAP